MSARRQTNTFSGGLNILNKNNISKACNCSGVYMIKNTLNEKKYISAYGFLWKLKNNNYECITTS